MCGRQWVLLYTKTLKRNIGKNQCAQHILLLGGRQAIDRSPGHFRLQEEILAAAVPAVGTAKRCGNLDSGDQLVKCTGHQRARPVGEIDNTYRR